MKSEFLPVSCIRSGERRKAMSEKKFEVVAEVRARLTQEDIDDIMVTALE